MVCRQGLNSYEINYTFSSVQNMATPQPVDSCMIIADEATGRQAPPMMGYRLHIPNVRPQVNGRQLKSVTHRHASSQ